MDAQDRLNNLIMAALFLSQLLDKVGEPLMGWHKKLHRREKQKIFFSSGAAVFIYIFLNFIFEIAAIHMFPRLTVFHQFINIMHIFALNANDKQLSWKKTNETSLE